MIIVALKIEIVSRFASNISLRLQACAMRYTITAQTRRNLPFDTRAHTCLVSQNDKEKRKQKCYGLTSTREFLRKYAHRERLKTF